MLLNRFLKFFKNFVEKVWRIKNNIYLCSPKRKTEVKPSRLIEKRDQM